MKKGENIAAFLGKSTEFEGRLSFHETARIDGHVKGEISSERTLIVGEEALIEATIHTSTIIIYGEIHGDIIAGSRISREEVASIMKEADVYANSNHALEKDYLSIRSRLFSTC